MIIRTEQKGYCVGSCVDFYIECKDGRCYPGKGVTNYIRFKEEIPKILNLSR